MIKVLFPENSGDLRVIMDAIEQNYACENDPSRKNTSAEFVAVLPCHERTSWAKWTVIDNRDHQAFCEDFATLDGALIYATDLRTTCEDQIEWDNPGAFLREMLEATKGKK